MGHNIVVGNNMRNVVEMGRIVVVEVEMGRIVVGVVMGRIVVGVEMGRIVVVVVGRKDKDLVEFGMKMEVVGRFGFVQRKDPLIDDLEKMKMMMMNIIV
ncbi:hypothetical protein M8C21_012425 [Ambrosia artemisiifolia]|uniref:Uncharacterized protein n=1 Tax=Ambrosia artemisiifolia TaxID=4212 RepID=A0AAD5CYE3_AMBAR|nr:hypothetical protein M8C21_012425 [Ambrosia artemisiifolia]